MRIERMKRWLVHRGVLTREELDKPGHAAPFWLAAAALEGKRMLSAWEMWTVLRWYAHNRGYDGNTRWSGGEDDPEDTEKVKNAANLMREAGASTMCHTVCHRLDLDPADEEKLSSMKPYKTLNAAFPRKTVSGEVAELLRMHDGKVKGLDSKTIRFLMSQDELGDENRAELLAAGIKLPNRYEGGLLFGQLVPRFDNRIISRCPITWAAEFDKAKSAGKSDDEARHLAEKYAKVPAAKCPEYLEYRFARILANIKANGAPLAPDTRRYLFDTAKARGRFTASELKKEVETRLGTKDTNLEAYFNIHPDSDKALVLDPAAVLPHANRTIKPMWPHLGEKAHGKALAVWRRGKGICLAQLLEFAKDGGDPTAAEAALRGYFDKQPKKDTKNTSWDEFLMKPIRADYDSGRAPYARPVLKQVVTEVLAGFDPTKPAVSQAKPDGEKKAADGILYAPLDPASRVRELMAERPLDSLTNNHLVRHRLLILGRLLDDIMAEFKLTANDGSLRVIVEVARELKEFSGMTAKQITAELNSRLKDFKAAVDHLEKNAPHLLADSSQRGGLIRKCRIAMDMGWRCPFTGDKYDAADLPKLEREHIIPYATRNTNALHALVLTWPEVNRMKGKRTARQFIEECAELPSRQVAGLERLTLFTPKQYEAFVEALDTKGHDDDRRRKQARKALLATVDFEDKELGFTEGQLTQSSHLMKLAMGEIKRQLPGAAVDPVPGPVTAEIRKSWSLTGTLALACPEVLDGDGKVRPKDEIRGLTHLHHALDAATLALAAHYIPFQARGLDQKGKIWQALLKRSQSEDEKKFLLGLGCCQIYQKGGRSGEKATVVGLKDLAPQVKNALRRSLAEARVMQHVPADRSGARAELTTWGVVEITGEGDDARVKIRQRSVKVEDGLRKITQKNGEERAGKLLGINPKGGKGKLKAIKGAMVIGENYGIALDPTPVVIPFFDVTGRLGELTKANGGKKPRVLRNGMLIRLKSSPPRSRQDYSGIWRIASIKNNMGRFLIDMVRPGYITPQNGVLWAGMNKTLEPLLECGLEVLPQNFCGHGSKK
ncbi:MAG: hypothetical protein J0M04_05130 [Verrucomicrobia bacterium]|nr:hypothetical protein [Verrucomicrobiota bacterium]